MAPAVGDVIGGKYRVEKILGKGGFGVVVAATHLQLKQRVALKFLLPQVLRERGILERFMREAQAMAGIRSQHVARVLDVGELSPGAPYIVMEFLEGDDLGEVLARRGPLPVAAAAAAVLEACEALAEAHGLGIVHRDLKPTNLFRARGSGGQPIIKVLDFGISKVAAAAGEEASLTQTNHVLGSPVYASPEQLRSTKHVDHRTDIWSLGVTLYQLVSGALPFIGQTLSEISIKIAMDPPAPLPPSIPPRFAAVIYRCLEKEPGARYPSIDALTAALADFATEPAAPPVAPTLTTLNSAASESMAAPTIARSRPWRRLAIGGALAAVVAAGAIIAISARRSAAPIAPVAVAGPAPPAPPAPTVERLPQAPDGMILVEGGTLRQGRAAYGNDLALDVPIHEVAVATFAIDRIEVTNAELKPFVDAGKARAPWPRNAPFQVLAPLPVVKVTHADAEAFCRWRHPSGRLPTETEWEWAARGAEGRLYPWGNELRGGCVNGLRRDGALEASEKRACGATLTGIMALSGNVWEWTSSAAAAYPGSRVSAPPGEYHVVRGGSFFNTRPDDLTATVRQFVKEPNDYVGFRCAADVSSP